MRANVSCGMAPPQISDRDIAIIDNWYHTKARRIEEVFQETVKIMSRMTKNVSMVLAPQVSQCTFRYIQFLPLDEQRSIVVIVTDTGLLENKIIEIPNKYTKVNLKGYKFIKYMLRKCYVKVSIMVLK